MVANDNAGELDERGALESIASKLAPTVSAWAQSLVGAGLPAMVVNDNAGQLDERGALESIASKLAPTVSAWAQSLVGAGLPAMVVNDNAGQLDERGALESIASKLAPTVLAWARSPVGAGLPAMVVNDYAGELDKRGAFESIASRLAPTVLAWARSPVGAGLPAMVVNDNACGLDKRGALESIASRLAPTVPRECVKNLFFDRTSLMQRIVILGNAGSGKSTLARTLGKRLGLPVVHLDTLFWEPGWVEPDAVQFRARVSAAIAADSWICEGNYARRTFDLRLPRADLIIWLDTPRLTCFARVILRSVLNRPRPDLAAGCAEKLDRAFLTFLEFVWNFDRGYRPGIEAVRLAMGPRIPVVHLRNSRQIATFLHGLPAMSGTCLE
ncbi:adenylate kinase family enzyme [Pseudomonas sp. AP3_22 TE3818]